MAANPCTVQTIYPGMSYTHMRARARSVNPVLRPPPTPRVRPASQAVCMRTSSHTAVIVSDGWRRGRERLAKWWSAAVVGRATGARRGSLHCSRTPAAPSLSVIPVRARLKGGKVNELASGACGVATAAETTSTKQPTEDQAAEVKDNHWGTHTHTHGHTHGRTHTHGQTHTQVHRDNKPMSCAGGVGQSRRKKKLSEAVQLSFQQDSSQSHFPSAKSYYI